MTGILDLRGLKCPLPAMLTKKALAPMPAGAMVTVLADDPLAVVDIPHMCHGEGHAVDSVAARNGYNEFALRVRSATASAAPPRQGPDA
ncbi:MAG TPA: sulfurtransferase TusA family protein [Rhizomicrobium sp.]|jgi:tRNA 2-thiouridine synthesizing protein A|nr:sulfurtransferase TusA family protein [Rhizomicrobium sp.]